LSISYIELRNIIKSTEPVSRGGNYKDSERYKALKESKAFKRVLEGWGDIKIESVMCDAMSRMTLEQFDKSANTFEGWCYPENNANVRLFKARNTKYDYVVDAINRYMEMVSTRNNAITYFRSESLKRQFVRMAYEHLSCKPSSGNTHGTIEAVISKVHSSVSNDVESRSKWLECSELDRCRWFTARALSEAEDEYEVDFSYVPYRFPNEVEVNQCSVCGEYGCMDDICHQFQLMSSGHRYDEKKSVKRILFLLNNARKFAFSKNKPIHNCSGLLDVYRRNRTTKIVEKPHLDLSLSLQKIGFQLLDITAKLQDGKINNSQTLKLIREAEKEVNRRDLEKTGHYVPYHEREKEIIFTQKTNNQDIELNDGMELSMY